MPSSTRFELSYSIPWNLLLITVGGLLFALGAKGVLVHHGFIAGGLFGASLLAHYIVPGISAGLLYAALNVPLFIAGWFLVSRRFFLYSLYAMGVTTLAYELLSLNFGIADPLNAAIAGGVLCGAGAGVVLRSLGSNGGLDIIAVILNQRVGLGIGKFYFLFNLGLFSLSFLWLPPDAIITSLLMVFITSVAVDYCIGLFSQRKVVFIVSDQADRITERITKELRMGATWLNGQGAYTGRDKKVIMTVVNNVRIKRLEEIVFTTDDQALFVAENTFAVLGSTFAKRKVY